MDRWYVIDNCLKKNPTEEEFKDVPRHQIIELRIGNCEDLIIETWWVGLLKNNQTIDFAYSPSELKTSYLSKYEMRVKHFENHGVNSKDVAWEKAYTLPPSYFLENGIKNLLKVMNFWR